jgi:hypothetical protein
MRRRGALAGEAAATNGYRWVPRMIGFPSTTFGLASMPILHSSGIRLTYVRSHPKQK